MFTLVLLVHGFLCIFMILLVLVQQGKGADAGALMGSGAESILGAGSAGTFMSRLTTAVAIAFMATSILLVKLYTGGAAGPQRVDVLKGSILEQAAPQEENAPAARPDQPSPETAPGAPSAPPAQAPQLPPTAPDVAGK